MSAVAAILPELDYDYEVYRQAVDDLVQVSMSYDLTQRRFSGLVPPGWHEEIHILTRREFVDCLEFREEELVRLIGVWETTPDHDQFRLANEFHWPKQWGDLGWNTGIIRSQDPHVWEAEEDLFRVRTAIAWQRDEARPEAKPSDKGSGGIAVQDNSSPAAPGVDSE